MILKTILLSLILSTLTILTTHLTATSKSTVWFQLTVHPRQFVPFTSFCKEPTTLASPLCLLHTSHHYPPVIQNVHYFALFLWQRIYIKCATL